MAVCHVLRYFPPVLKIREIIDKGLIGEVVTIDHRHSIYQDSKLLVPVVYFAELV